MQIPGFSAHRSLYSWNALYRQPREEGPIHSAIVLQARCPTGGTCRQASRNCRDPERGGEWCDILGDCFDCLRDGKGTSAGGSTGSGTTGATVCPPGQTNCGGFCKDLMADSSNCGACGAVCTTGVCCSGVCGPNCGGGTCCQGSSTCCTGTLVGTVCCLPGSTCMNIFGLKFCL